MKKILLFIAIIFSTHTQALEFQGKFLQGHFILGKAKIGSKVFIDKKQVKVCLLYTSPSPRDDVISRMPSSA